MYWRTTIMLSRVAGVFVLLALSVLAAAAPVAAVEQADTVHGFDTTDRVLTLTFDAGSDRGYAPLILDTLRDEGIKASFGMTGGWAGANPDLIHRMVNEGHHLMNHSWTHRSFTGA